MTNFTLETSESGETVVNWQGELNIAGKLAAVGPKGLLDRIASKNIDTFIEGIKSGIEELSTAPRASAALARGEAAVVNADDEQKR